MLEDDGVAEHEVGGGEPGHLVGRVVPRHHAEESADRLPTDEGFTLAGGQGDRLVGEEGRRVPGVVGVDLGAELDLPDGLVERLAHLAADDGAEGAGPLGV